MDNTQIFFFIYNLHGKFPFLDQLMILGADYLIYITFILGVILAVIKGIKEKKALLFTIIGLIISYILVHIIYIFIKEPRPFTTFPITTLINPPDILSFPSIHTTRMAVIAFAFLLAKSKFAPLFIIFLIWVGFARIFVGVHYPLDILGGIVIGFISILLVSQFKDIKKGLFARGNKL